MLKNPKQLKYIAPFNIPNSKSGDIEIKNKWHPADEPIIAVSVRTAIFTGQKPLTITYNRPIPITTLSDKKGTWMITTPAEQVQAHNALRRCKGRVLVGGLGLGYFVKKLQEKDNVTSVVVVEISQDVINLVWKYHQFDQRFQIICTDIKKYLKRYTSNRRFDWVYLDIWRGDGEGQFINTVLPLKRLVHKTVCNKVSHILSWQEEVMLGQIQTGIQTHLLLELDKIKSMPKTKFDKTFKGKYLITRKVFWNHLRQYNLNVNEALNLLPTYINWIRNGMNGEF